jgi:hypothetical protein
MTSSYLDWPAWPDRVPEGLSGTESLRAGNARFYSYSLGEFIGSEWLLRIDAQPEVLEKLASENHMVPRNTAPDLFWKMPPYYWPRDLPKGGRLYSIASIPEDRGPDGDHFLMLIDPQRSRAFVWFKNND